MLLRGLRPKSVTSYFVFVFAWPAATLRSALTSAAVGGLFIRTSDRRERAARAQGRRSCATSRSRCPRWARGGGRGGWIDLTNQLYGIRGERGWRIRGEFAHVV